MKNLVKFIGKSLLGGMFFCIGVLLVYAATTISGLGQKTIESGDKIGTGWFNEVDNKLNNFNVGTTFTSYNQSKGCGIADEIDSWTERSKSFGDLNSDGEGGAGSFIGSPKEVYIDNSMAGAWSSSYTAYKCYVTSFSECIKIYSNDFKSGWEEIISWTEYFGSVADLNGSSDGGVNIFTHSPVDLQAVNGEFQQILTKEARIICK